MSEWISDEAMLEAIKRLNGIDLYPDPVKSRETIALRVYDLDADRTGQVFVSATSDGAIEVWRNGQCVDRLDAAEVGRRIRTYVEGTGRSYAGRLDV